MFPALSSPGDFDRHDTAKLKALAEKLRISAPTSPILAAIEECLRGRGGLQA